ncbi:MAG: hypothetical protein KC912_00940 [Proteobacteria bacterium]|nr:hypothetical protein [Pseudomonadota bacterium]
MRLLFALTLAGCGTPSTDDSQDTEPVEVDPCLGATDLAHWPQAVVLVDDVAIHDFQGGANELVEAVYEGTLESPLLGSCPGGLAIDTTAGERVEIDICVNGGPQLAELPGDGRSVRVAFKGLNTTRGEFELAVTDADGLLFAVNVDGLDDALLEPLRVVSGADQLVCLDEEAFQTLEFSMDEVSVEVDSGGETTLDTLDYSYEVRNLLTVRGTVARHPLEWAGALFSVYRLPAS